MSRKRTITKVVAPALACVLVYFWGCHIGVFIPKSLRVSTPSLTHEEREGIAERAVLRFGFRDAEPSGVVVRPVACVGGTFARSTRIEAALHRVRSREIELYSVYTSRRSPNALPYTMWGNMSVLLLLGEAEDEGTRKIGLACVGASRGFGSLGAAPYDIEPVHTYSLTGRVSRKNEYIVYVEGDREFTVDRTMSPKEFAARNEGSFILVSMYVH